MLSTLTFCVLDFFVLKALELSTENNIFYMSI